MNSPDFWRWGNGLCPDHRGYPPTFRQGANPIGGEYLEIPSIADIHSHRYRHGQKGGKVRAGDLGRLMSRTFIEKQLVRQLISFSVNRRMSNTTKEGAYATE
jgi:hypothetical protein